MSKFNNVFNQKKVLLTVNHVYNYEQGRKNTEISIDNGADGIFLINHGIRSDLLIPIYEKLRKEFKQIWFGVNLLDNRTKDMFAAIPANMQGVWADNAHIDEYSNEQPEAEEIKDSILNNNFKGLYFGGVAFKYQRKVENYSQAAKTAMNYVDVVTTSGLGTAKAPDVAKIEIMKNALGNFPLAIASGITTENVSNFLPYTDCFLVASGISYDFENLDPEKVKRLADIIHSFS